MWDAFRRNNIGLIICFANIPYDDTYSDWQKIDKGNDEHSRDSIELEQVMYSVG